jgi:hypothetical protein
MFYLLTSLLIRFALVLLNHSRPDCRAFRLANRLFNWGMTRNLTHVASDIVRLRGRNYLALRTLRIESPPLSKGCPHFAPMTAWQVAVAA